jgi:hypothetical protein
MGMLSKLISTYMQRNMCHYWYSAHDLHTISAGHNIGNKWTLLIITQSPKDHKINCTWVELFTITTLHEYTDLFLLQILRQKSFH